MKQTLYILRPNHSGYLYKKKSRQDQTRHPISTFRPKGISIWSVDFDNPKVNGDTSIFDSIVLKS